VTLVERPEKGDPSRRTPTFFAALNRGKRSVALDLKAPAGRDALLRLLGHADVLIEGFRPGALTRLGLGFDEVSRVAPELVYVSVSGFGQDGPFRDLPGHDLSFQALSGHLAGEIAAPRPRTPRLVLGNLAGGMFAAIGVLAALRARDQSGRGAFVDVSLLDSLVSLLTVPLAPVLNRARSETWPDDPGYGLFRTSDGKLVALSIFGEDQFWSALCGATGLERHAAMDLAARTERHDLLQRQLGAALLSKPLRHWSRVFRAKKIPFSPVLDLPDVTRHPQIKARGTVVAPPDGRDRPARRHVRQPVRIQGYDTGPRGHVPSVGEHTRDVLSSSGFTPDEIARLFAAGVAYEAGR